MKSVNFAIVEDEPPARLALRRMVEELSPGSFCMGEAGDGPEGLDLLRRFQPDLLFLDIEFPPDGAFGMLERARQEGLPIPPVAFVTAYNAHAIEAFRWAACDYLLKPVDPIRLAETLRRVRRLPDLDLLFQTLHATQLRAIPERFTVMVKDRLKVFQWREVSYIQTESRMVFVHTREGRFMLDRAMDELERSLAPGFLRIHRSILVNLAYAKELIPDPGHTSSLILHSGERLPVSRDRLPSIKNAFG